MKRNTMKIVPSKCTSLLRHHGTKKNCFAKIDTSFRFANGILLWKQEGKKYHQKKPSENNVFYLAYLKKNKIKLYMSVVTQTS